MHIFLTGEKRIGKSTAIKNYLKHTGAAADGFITYWEPGGEAGAVRTLYLAPFDSGPVYEERRVLTVDRGSGPAFSDDILHVFNTYGSGILNDSGRFDYIIMDELGFLETKAPLFKQAVMQRIEGDIPILGVIKGSKTGFLNEIRAHPNVEIREVTAENRNTILPG